ncbi:MAG TPA: hypothetical protein VNG53_08185 [Bacteroidia bacterium]|nr:hypothetical protein [Bacteroidia bacterium]
MEKRVYMSGYHIEWNKSKRTVNKREFANKENEKQPKQNKITTPQLSKNNYHSIGIIAEKQITKSLKQKNIFRINNLKTFINFSNIDTSLSKRTIKKKAGLKKIENNGNNNELANSTDTKKKQVYSHFAVEGFICSLAGILLPILLLYLSALGFFIPSGFSLLPIILFIFGFLYSLKGIRETKKYGMKGQLLAVFGLAFVIAVFTILILYVALLFLAFG